MPETDLHHMSRIVLHPEPSLVGIAVSELTGSELLWSMIYYGNEDSISHFTLTRECNFCHNFANHICFILFAVKAIDLENMESMAGTSQTTVALQYT
jgi:hypothetical protein